MEALTLPQLKTVAHSLGIDLYNAVMSNKKKDKQLPKEFYRNYYNTNNEEVLADLLAIGVMEHREATAYYHVTKKGIFLFSEQFKELAKYQPTGVFDLDYLKHRINFYCDFYNYRFCPDNSEHVINEFVNKYLEGYYMSHTTTDAVNTFKNELKRYHKANALKPSYSL